MKAEPLSVGKVLSENQRFVVPIYQRTYTWTLTEQIEPFWEQVESKSLEVLATGKAAFPHYMGSLLVVPETEAAFGQLQSYDIVDGQQRITTFHLLFAALRAVARELSYTDLTKSISDLLLFADEPPPTSIQAGRYKLQPTSHDRELFRDLVDMSSEELRYAYPDLFYSSGRYKKMKAPLPLGAYAYFYERVWEFLDVEPTEHRNRFRAISEAVFQSFRFIVITLSKEDDPQVIFETLNTGGKPLAAMDLVRNDVFLRAVRRSENAETIMQKYWSTFETSFWKEVRAHGKLRKPTMDFFLTHVLSAETGKVISPSEIYSEYKSFSRSNQNESVEEELRKVIKYVGPYKSLVHPIGSEPLDDLSRLLQVFDTSTAYPPILLIATSSITEDERNKLFSLIGSFVVRRALCGLTGKNYNLYFGDLTSQFRHNGVSESTFALLAEARKNTEATRFPDDQEVRDAIRNRDQYNRLPASRLSFILGQLELASRDKFSASGSLKTGLWVEHIMPQNWRQHWPLRSGKQAPERESFIVDEALRDEVSLREQTIHNLGNLTLLTPASNVSAGHASFSDKKGRLIGSLTSMNAALAQLAKWDEADIASRAEQLADLALKIWPFPSKGAVSA